MSLTRPETYFSTMCLHDLGCKVPTCNILYDLSGDETSDL